MKAKLTKRQVKQYQDNGFIVIEDFLSAKELATWREVTEDAVRQRLLERNGLTNQKNPDSYYAQVFTQCVRLADTHAGMAELMLDERLGEMAGALAGVDGIRIWHDQALFKPPYGNPTAWHLDNPYWSFYSRDAISIWVALDDATLANGCLWYIPGTHKLARYDNVGIGHNIRDLFKVYPEWAQMEAVAAPARAGSAVFNNGRVAHGAGANMTPRPRRAMTCAYMPDGSTFNGQQNVLRDDYFKSLKQGDAICDDTQAPLIWRQRG
jgi:ectoine hydroxylase-related dioxygenase (phytanoyl-CoA dioxygenase family)